MSAHRPTTRYDFSIQDEIGEPTAAALVAPLAAFNRSKAGPSHSCGLFIILRDSRGDVVGGLSGETSRGWLFIDYLVVPEEDRGQGIGRQVVAMAESEAISRGCIGSWLNTFEFQARGFYEKLGYECFGQIDDHPPGYSRFFMKKKFAITSA
ncbi:MAG: GNAT family N-acetyltransferase [Betaproteobacteria bacterium]|nr:MAG: GNAT family N-acetyltransferase [Betaproteobacteria bacterium]